MKRNYTTVYKGFTGLIKHTQLCSKTIEKNTFLAVCYLKSRSWKCVLSKNCTTDFTKEFALLCIASLFLVFPDFQTNLYPLDNLCYKSLTQSKCLLFTPTGLLKGVMCTHLHEFKGYFQFVFFIYIVYIVSVWK